MNEIGILVETPKGSSIKYKYDPEKKKFEAHKMLPVGLAFPFDFGFITGTKGEDGDPLDVLILSEFSFLQGAMVKCKVIGSMKAEQTEGKKTIRNDRIFVIPAINGLIPVYGSLDDVQREKMKEIGNFFIYYNMAEGKTFKPLGILSARETLKIIKQQRSFLKNP